MKILRKTTFKQIWRGMVCFKQTHMVKDKCPVNISFVTLLGKRFKIYQTWNDPEMPTWYLFTKFIPVS